MKSGKKNKLDYFLLLFLALLLTAGVFSYAKACRRAATVFLSPSSGSAAPTDSRDSLELPILMYHGISESNAGESDYVISADRLEADLQWLHKNDYTTILPSQMIAYVKNGAKLPARPVILSFDDGYCNNYLYAFPLLEKYQAKAVIALIGADVEISSNDIYRVPSSCSLSWAEAAQMYKSGLVEFASHTYNLHRMENGRKGADRKNKESAEDYRKFLTEDLQKNQEAIAIAVGRAPQVFAWPYGAYPSDGSADPILKSLGLEASFTSYQHTSAIYRGDPDSLFGLGRYLRTPSFPIETINGSAEDARGKNSGEEDGRGKV